jgi:electron transfer flavoprotein alpha subunit
MTKPERSILIYGDYRNYFKSRVTLQLISRARDLATKIGASVSTCAFGSNVDEWAGEYLAHGSDKVFVYDDPILSDYSIELYSELLARLTRELNPEIILIGATSFGREMAPVVAKKLQTGLTADCVGLDINEEGLLVQTAPSFGGNLLAEIITPVMRPQMATVRPGVFKEIPHNEKARGDIIKLQLPANLPKPRVRFISSEKIKTSEHKLEDARIVVCGGRGMGSAKRFKNLFEMARLMDGQVGATRPAVHGQWAPHENLVGQAGRHIKPNLLFSFGISGAIQHTAAITGADFIIAVNKNQSAPMMGLADVAIVTDANQAALAIIKELRKRLKN